MFSLQGRGKKKPLNTEKNKWKSNIGLERKKKKQSGRKTWPLVTSALLRRAFVPLVPHRLNISPRVPLSQNNQPLTEEWSKKMFKRANNWRKDKSASLRGKAAKGEKRMDCAHCDCARGIKEKTILKRGSLKCVHKHEECVDGWIGGW